jgi:UDP-glucose 4-epimerase
MGPAAQPLRRHQVGHGTIPARLPAVLRHGDAGVPLLQRLRSPRGESLWINGDGSNSRDFTYVGTVCRVLLDACERRVSHPEPVNLAFGTNTSLLELVAAIEHASGLSADVQHRGPRAGDVPHSQADNATLRSLFPEVVPVELTEGLHRTLDWFKENS